MFTLIKMLNTFFTKSINILYIYLNKLSLLVPFTCGIWLYIDFKVNIPFGVGFSWCEEDLSLYSPSLMRNQIQVF